MSVDVSAWTTLNRVKRHVHIGLSDSSKDTFLEEIINSTYKVLEKHIGRQVLQATYTEYYDGDSSGRLILKKWPVISVTSIHVDPEREFGSDDLMDADDYYLDTELGIVEVFQATGSGPTSFPKGIKNVKAVYVAGFTSIPADLAQVATEYAAFVFNRSGTEGFRSQSLGQKSESYEVGSLRIDLAIPLYLTWKLDQYKERSV